MFKLVRFGILPRIVDSKNTYFRKEIESRSKVYSAMRRRASRIHVVLDEQHLDACHGNRIADDVIRKYYIC